MTNSKTLFDQAKQVLVGGVNSPVRAFKSVGGTPIFMKSGKGPYLFSEDGQRYIDYVLAWGAMLLGHADETLTEALRDQLLTGTAFGAPTAIETELAVLVQDFFPSMKKIRFVNSGTEATMSAVRVARGVTKRNLIVKFNGAYHGHVDSLLVGAGSGGLTFGKPESEGVPAEFIQHTAVLEYNDISALADLFHFKGDQIAAVIVEPVCGNMGVVLPVPDFLKTLRQLCTRYHSLLIFDEVMTGFRVHQGGAQALYNVEPDLTCIGKVIGAGIPSGAYGGRADVMDAVAPLGGVYQAGTFSGNAIAMRAGITVLTKLKTHNIVAKSHQNATYLVDGLRAIFRQASVPITINHVGSMFSLYFCDGPIQNVSDTKKSDTSKFNAFYHKMLDHGIYMAPSAFEANFISSVHSPQDLTQTLAAVEKSVKF